MKENKMKCSDFWQKERDLKTLAMAELAKAVEAHGGSYEWCDEDGNIDRENTDAPIVCYLRDGGPVDVLVKAVIHDERGWWISGESNEEWGGDIDIDDPYDIVSAHQIQAITEAIPATKEVSDVTTCIDDIRLRPHEVISVDCEDLKQRGYDGDNVTNEQLEEIAGYMRNFYLDGAFYDDMAEACFMLKIPKIEKEED